MRSSWEGEGGKYVFLFFVFWGIVYVEMASSSFFFVYQNSRKVQAGRVWRRFSFSFFPYLFSSISW